MNVFCIIFFQVLYLLILSPTLTHALKAEFVYFYRILCKVSNVQRSLWMWKASYNSKYRSIA
jgi:hypothetical protein